MPARKTASKPARKTASKPDPLGELRVEVFAALGETSLKAECPLHAAAAVAARLHDELEALVARRPRLAHTLDVVPGGDALYVWDEGEDDDGARRRGLGFTA